VQSLDGRTRQTLIRGAALARYSATGHLVYSRAGTLFAVPFDLDTRHVSGPAVKVLDDVREDPQQGVAQFALSRNGTLAYISGGLLSNEVAWVDRGGRVKPFMPQGERRMFSQVRLSPNGGQVAVSVGGGNNDVWLYDVGREVLTRFTAGGANHLYPNWTPDGSRLSFLRSEAGQLLWRPVDQSGPEEVIATLGEGATPQAWSPDGRYLVFTQAGETTGPDIWALNMADRRRRAIVQTRFTERAPTFSPDGKWLAYSSDESGQFEVYVQRFPERGERQRVSRAGGMEPLWARSGKELYFREDDKLMAAAMVSPLGRPQELFRAPWWALPTSSRTNFEIAPDGQGFLLLRSSDAETRARLHVIVNWAEELKRLVAR
jgi:eukaryotic-like serine/threonine-protein kinase